MSAETFHVEALIFVVILVVYVLTSHIIENKKIPYLHEASIAIIMGLLTSLISKYVLLSSTGPWKGNQLLQRTLLRPHPPSHHFLCRLQSQKISLLLKLRNDQLSGNLRNHHWLYFAGRVSHISQLFLLDIDLDLNFASEQCDVRD